MSPVRSSKFLLRSLLIANLLVGAAVFSGCGPDGAGSIHIDSPKATQKMPNRRGGRTGADRQALSLGYISKADSTFRQQESRSQEWLNIPSRAVHSRRRSRP